MTGQGHQTPEQIANRSVITNCRANQRRPSHSEKKSLRKNRNQFR
uniref:Uncharacterized protein n=1 Tax=Arundo donax TaxID=35708 RepID=A0A0A9BYL7_ARUDO